MIETDILTIRDALTYAPAVWDVAVSNPPFFRKDEFLACFYALGKPLALLMPGTVLDSVVRRDPWASPSAAIDAKSKVSDRR